MLWVGDGLFRNMSVTFGTPSECGSSSCESGMVSFVHQVSVEIQVVGPGWCIPKFVKEIWHST